MTKFSLMQADLGPQPTLEWLDLTDLYVDKKYQRATNSKQSQKIIGKILFGFNWTKFQPPTVACVEDKQGEIRYAVVDGQHRFIACQKHPLITEIPCYIITADGIADQANSFAAINKNRVHITPVAIYHAEVAAGDPDAMRVKRVCDKTGVKVASHTNTQSHKANETVAVTVISKLSGRQYGEHRMELTLTTLRRASGGGGSMLKAHLIKAVFAIQELNCRKSVFDQDHLVSALQFHTADGWQKAVTAYREALRIAALPALVTLIAREYNKGRQKYKMTTGTEESA